MGPTNRPLISPAAALPRLLGAVLIVTSLGGVTIGAQSSARDRLAPGVSAALAQHRAATLRDVRYDVALDLPAARSAPITGTTTIRVVRRDTGALVLDFDARAEQVHEVVANGRSLGALAPANGHLVVPATALRRGENAITVRFTAGDAPFNRSSDFLYTIFVPARARQAMPVFDQPDLKARVTLSVTLPAAWQVVSNGADVARTTTGDRATVRFAETAPLPTYLVALAAGDFAVDSAVRDGRTLRLFHRERDAAKVARNRDAIYDLHAQSLAWMERYTGIAYPWGKFDAALIPAFQFGGMEHAGAVFYNASSLLLDSTATLDQRLGRASLIAHETAHLWFGDLVTMRWFDDVWLKEVFANFFAAKIVNPAFPDVDHDLRFYLAHYPSAYDVDRTEGTHPIRQRLENLDEAGGLYGAIIYQKAPIVMRMLEALTGEAAFRRAMQRYLATYRFGNATWPELVRILDRETPEDLAAWNRTWVEGKGRAALAGRAVRDSAGRVRRLDIPQREARAGAVAYGAVRLDSASRADLLRDLPRVPRALDRGVALVTLHDELREGRVAPVALQQAALALAESERDEQLLARTLGVLTQVRWTWLEPGERAEAAPDVERRLRAGLASAPTTGARLSWFRALVRTATTAPSLAWLEGVWRGDSAVAGLVLGEEDRTTLALQLAVREVPRWREILEGEQSRLANPDRRARFAFVRPAVDADPSVRAAWFESLREPANRRREPWVLDGLALLHHPLRADGSVTLVPPALAMLEEVRATGDIFFPRRWLDAVLGGHRSPEAAAAVRAYLADRATLTPRLRLLVLQASDDLRRLRPPPR